jgi:hypothetical protein
MDEQAEQISRSELLEAIRTEHNRLEVTLAQLDEAQMIRPGVVGDWSVKDILAHIVAWEQRMVRWVGEALQGKLPADPDNWDQVHALNAQIYQENRDRSLADVLEEFPRSYQEALHVAETTGEKDLLDPGRFAWREGKPLWKVVAANTCWHYREHDESIRAWLAARE